MNDKVFRVTILAAASRSWPGLVPLETTTLVSIKPTSGEYVRTEYQGFNWLVELTNCSIPVPSRTGMDFIPFRAGYFAPTDTFLVEDMETVRNLLEKFLYISDEYNDTSDNRQQS